MIQPPATRPQGSLVEADYEAIEQAVMETARGRWFLAEYARRNRHADTTAVLDAIGRLEGAMGSARPSGDLDRVRLDIREMAHAIARTKAEIAAIKPEGATAQSGHFEDASVELDAIVQATERATGDILSAAETIQEIAWTLREMGAENEVCDLIDTKTTDIYTACSFQDITGQRTRKVINVLRFLEERIDTMMAIWGEPLVAPAPAPPLMNEAAKAVSEEAALLNGPAKPGEGLVQSDVDMMLDDGLFADGQEAQSAPAAITPAPEPAPAAAAPGPATPVMAEPAPAARAPLVEDVPATARATAAAALSTDDRPLAETPRAPRTDAPLAPGLGAVEEIEKLSFVEKVALTS
ncbi:protein phosphatase CheZ [Phreatobacter oligotrophus]|uniref:protein phosphatase CheZ n=1 Tax=Phreatobacter oligotrophus TaxID=1122261 RepID=UPI001FEB541C|nr:protein phosphatase CheZ [Phreatobacter oligotrophus]